MSTEQIIPRPAGEIKPYKSPEKHWEEVCDEIYGSHELPQTIRHQHDPEWDRRLLSIQNIHDQFIFDNHGFHLPRRIGIWTVIGILFAIGWAGMWLYPFLIRGRR